MRIAGATTPTLIIHGREDRCTPVGQAHELYSALLEQGVSGQVRTSPTDWYDAGPTQHAVQFYDSEERLLDAVTGFLAPGLHRGEPAIVVATSAHRAALARRLAAAGVDCAAARRAGDLLELDAAELLAQFMAEGAPDGRLFNEVVGGLIARAGGRTAMFGACARLNLHLKACEARQMRRQLRERALIDDASFGHRPSPANGDTRPGRRVKMR